MMFMMLLYAMDCGALLTLAISIVPTCMVSLGINISHKFMTMCIFNRPTSMLCHVYEWSDRITDIQI